MKGSTMSRIAIPDITSATGATADIYARVKKISGGRVPNTGNFQGSCRLDAWNSGCF
jgi:hypothetical protein